MLMLQAPYCDFFPQAEKVNFLYLVISSEHLIFLLIINIDNKPICMILSLIEITNIFINHGCYRYIRILLILALFKLIGIIRFTILSSNRLIIT